MINTLLSGDRFNSRLLGAIIISILICLAFAPFLFPGTRSLEVAARICIFILLAGSFDMLLGYAGIVSFAHTMFFGIGAYGVGIALNNMGGEWAAIFIGSILAILLSVVLALLIGMLSLRVKAIFFAMITLAVASFVMILASQLHGITGGEDGITYKIPRLFSPAFKLFDDKILGVRFNGKVVAYYVVFFLSLILFLTMLRIVNSPFGRVLQAIRENEFRAEALGYQVVIYRTVAFCLSAIIATIAGIEMGVWLKYTGPDTSFSFTIMVDILLMVVIGGMGSMYGAVIGVVAMIMAQYYLKDLMAIGAEATANIPILPELLHPDRWLLWLGLLFILSVYYFPKGVVGKLRGVSS
ncbi:branched-chain amino acid ABC transporter permease [Sneathiella sp. P13V-1]|uniref:branched-chain amino acid ABC transporter permease n=1 Tax=Sneathiella sp. P13V-1 TaxID=2697366 RepID=UPI00187B96C4|nr:branched-chain amino acid ABC transporter permease [Sneathiella sp. P13V-1]MBE7635991.1 branched-chain amino acid ABC transporter permease [Sneathiella sp. P13V-1]